MKMKNLLFLNLLALSFLFVNQTFAQNVEITSEEANIQMVDQSLKNYLVEIAGPDAYYHKQQVENTKEIHLSKYQADGTVFPEGSYTLQVTPVFQLTEAQRATIIDLQSKNDAAGIKAFREANNLPDQVGQMVVNFAIQNGKFVINKNKEAKMPMPSHATQWNQDHPSLYASVQPFVAEYPNNLTLDETQLSEDAQVIATDLVVQGSVCAGFDCVNGESFGFDTQRYKENNLRIHFDDTSASASFPSNDWRIAINDTSNGGASYFAVQDATAGTTPLTIRAGAGNNAIYVNNNGNVGLGTASPVLELHVADGDTPSLRLEQNGASGWTPQTWDVAGNETNFFVRDVNNSSNLIFRLRAGAPANSIFVENDGHVGLGTASPKHGLQLESGNVFVKAGKLGVNVEPTVALDVLGSAKITGDAAIIGNTTFNGQLTAILSGSNTFFAGAPVLKNMLVMDASNGNVGIGLSILSGGTPSYPLEVGSDMVYKPTGGAWLGASDRRLKTDIKDYTDGLEALMQIRPVTYRYNGKLGLPSEKENVGIIAQEMQEIAPYMISPLKNSSEEAKDKDYLAYDGSALTYMLVNAVQEQQAIIEAQKSEINSLQSELASLQTLKAEVAALAELVKSQKGADASEAVGEE